MQIPSWIRSLFSHLGKFIPVPIRQTTIATALTELPWPKWAGVVVTCGFLYNFVHGAAPDQTEPLWSVLRMIPWWLLISLAALIPIVASIEYLGRQIRTLTDLPDDPRVDKVLDRCLEIDRKLNDIKINGNKDRASIETLGEKIDVLYDSGVATQAFPALDDLIGQIRELEDAGDFGRLHKVEGRAWKLVPDSRNETENFQRKYKLALTRENILAGSKDESKRPDIRARVLREHLLEVSNRLRAVRMLRIARTWWKPGEP